MSTIHRVAAFTVLLPLAAAAQTQNDESKYDGDKLSFPVNVRGTSIGKDKKPFEVCVPAKTSLRGGKVIDDPDSTATPKEKILIVGLANIFGEIVNCDATDEQIKSGKDKLDGREAIRIKMRDVNNLNPDRFGFTYGGLVVPFKYHVNGSKEFKGGSTIGGYMGYRFDRNTLGYGAKLITFFGPSTVAVEQTVDGATKTQNLAGLSAGLGVIGQVKGDFQMGLVFGTDRVSKSAKYADNGKWWVALSAGFDFTK